MKKIVITGLGAITPVGNTVEGFWSNLLAGTSGAHRVEAFDPEDMPFQFVCEVKGFEPAKYMARKVIRRTARPTQMAIAASQLALEDSGLKISSENSERVGGSYRYGRRRNC